MKTEEIERAYDDIVSGIRDGDDGLARSGMIAVAVGVALNVGRIADALDRIADNTKPVTVENKTDTGRDFIGMPQG